MPPETLYPFLYIFGAIWLLFVAGWYLVHTITTQRRRAEERRMGDTGSHETLILPPPAEGWASRFDLGFSNLIFRTGLEIEPALALGLILFFGVITATAMFIWRYDVEPWLAIPAFFLGAAVPLTFFIWRQGYWRRQLRDQLPDALYLLARSVRAGRSVDQAFQLIGEQGVPPLSREFARMHHQLELGLPLPDVLHSTSRRLGIADFNVFASIVSLHRTTGGNLPLLLDRLAATTRDRNQFERQYRAATVLGRYSAAFIAAMAAVVLFYFFFFQRDMAHHYFESGMGLTLFATAMALEVAGVLLLFWFLRYEY
jgi:tight adherence protein B